MAHLPSHPDSRDAPPSAPDNEPRSAKRRWVSVVWVAIIVVVVLTMVVLHLAGVVGPGTN
jgi:hypothetical protein